MAPPLPSAVAVQPGAAPGGIMHGHTVQCPKERFKVHSLEGTNMEVGNGPLEDNFPLQVVC